MKKLIVPTLCVLAGCAAGAALTPVVTAQWPDSPGAQRWQQECESIDSHRDAEINAVLRRRGEAGWEAVGFTISQSTMQFVCFKRPAP